MEEQVIPILHVANAANAAAWYKRIGFAPEWEHRSHPHLPAFDCIAWGTVRMFLSERKGAPRPDSLLYVWVHEVLATAKDFRLKVSQQPWAQEIERRDLDTNRLRIGTTKA
jgi:Glyoxalase superfamily protein